MLLRSFCKHVLLALTLLTPGLVWAQSTSNIPKKYDLLFMAYTERYMPGIDPDLLKAQCWQESRFKEKAVSPVGAAGLCQFMPGTFKDVSKQLKFPSGASAFDPSLSIQSAAFYMGNLRRSWSSPRPEVDRYNLALASYNAGLGHLLKAQKLSGGKNLYRDIIVKLPLVTGDNSKETKEYVIRIRGYYSVLKAEKGVPVNESGL